MSSTKTNEKPISFLPAYEDFSNQVNSLFVPQIICGAKFTNIFSHQMNIDNVEASIQSVSEFSLQPLLIHIDQYGQAIPASSRGWTTSLSANAANIGGASIHLASDGVFLNLLGAPSPFLIGDAKLITDGKKVNGLLSVNARQQISNINARFQMNKLEVPCFTEATAIFGSIKRAIGFRFQYDQNGQNSYQILGRFSTKKSIFQSDFSFVEDYRKNFLISTAVKKTAAPGLKFGAQFKISKQLETELNIGWDFRIGKSRVQSLVSSNKIVSSSLKRELNDNMFFDVSATIDNNSNDVILGLGLTLQTEK